MTHFIDIASLLALLQQRGPERFLRELADELHADFIRWNDFDKSPRTAAHSQLGVIELMPVSDATTYAFKYVNGHPANTANGLPTVMAFGVLADMATGYPVLLSELTLTTALRTAATSALAARALARPGARSTSGCSSVLPGQSPPTALMCMPGSTMSAVRIAARVLSAVTVVTMSAPRTASRALAQGTQRRPCCR